MTFRRLYHGFRGS